MTVIFRHQKRAAENVLHLTKMLTELHDVSNKVFSNALQVSNGSQTLAQGATEQASSIEELSAMVATVASGITENATMPFRPAAFLKKPKAV